MDQRARIRQAISSINDAFELDGARLPATPIAAFGDPAFRRAYGLRYAYVGGAMANGIASVELVTALAKAGMLGIYGAAGQAPAAVDRAVARLMDELGATPFGVNLIHSPSEAGTEARELRLPGDREQIRMSSASVVLELLRRRVTTTG